MINIKARDKCAEITTALAKNASIRCTCRLNTMSSERGNTNLEKLREETEAWSIVYFPHCGFSFFFFSIPRWFKLTNWFLWLLSFLTSDSLFLTSVSPSCWQTNATNQCNKTSMGLRIRRGNCKDGRRIRGKLAQLFRENPALSRGKMALWKGLCVFHPSWHSATMVLPGISWVGVGWWFFSPKKTFWNLI